MPESTITPEKPPTERTTSVLVKPVSASCNLACRYCFYRERPTDPYQGQSGRIMSRAVLANLVAQHMRLSGSAATFAWQGGEPTLAGLDFFRQVVAFQSRYGSRGQIVANALQTNGTLINPDWARFLAQYRFLVGISLDGPQYAHDGWRVGPGDNGSFAKVMASIELLRLYQVETNVLAVVHRFNASSPEETLAFFQEQGLTYLQFIPAVDTRPDGKLSEHSIGPREYGEYLCRLFDAWYNEGRPEVSIRLFDNLVALAAGAGGEMCELQSRCDTYYVVEYNGDVYPCDFFVAHPYRLGNITQTPIGEILVGQSRQRFAQARAKLPDMCSSCHWLPYCHGGCLRYRCVKGGSIYGEPFMCEATRMLFAHCWQRVLALAESLPTRGTQLHQ